MTKQAASHLKIVSILLSYIVFINNLNNRKYYGLREYLKVLKILNSNKCITREKKMGL